MRPEARFSASAGLLLAVALLLTITSTIDRSEARFLEALSRPFRSVYSKARNLKERALTAHRYEPSARLQGRSAGPSPSSSPDDERRVASSQGQGGGSGGGDGSETSAAGDFKSQCFLARGPNFKKPPKLFFFSTKTHAPETRGCQTNKTEQFELKTVESGDLMSDSPTLDRPFIQRELLQSGLFDASAPTYFIVHGFMASWNSDNWMCAIKDLVLDSTPANVFIVDWSGGAKPMLPIDYSASVSNTQYVGLMLGQFISLLLELTGQREASQFHLIGHSLGAHISGFTGYYVGSIGRITGLDPAGPCFTSEAQTDAQAAASDSGYLSGGKRRLSPESANFVLALHTDTALFGLNENCAHYDVYVNGGTGQPGCAATSLTGRVEDLFKLNIKDSFDLNLGCSHSYAHEMLDTYVSFVRAHDPKLNEANRYTRSTTGLQTGRLFTQGPSNGANARPSDRCYAIAYECASWNAFRAGECGFCADSDERCVFTGLSLFQYQVKKEAEPDSDWPNTIETSYRLEDHVQNVEATLNDDGQFNDEDEELDEAAKPAAGPAQPGPSQRFSQGQHFMRSGDKHETCLYQYQIIVAARKSDLQAISDSGKYYYYLHLPLEHSGLLTDSDGKRLEDRLVQVSHRLEHGAAAFEQLRSTYMDVLRQEDVRLDQGLRHNVEFYTALITFRQAPEKLCQGGGSTNGAEQKESWQLCRPLTNIQEARLWSSSEQKLNAVAWAALNYMSGLTYDIRMANSYVFERDMSERLKSRDELDHSSRPELSDLEARTRRNSFDNFVQGASNSAQCLLSVFDTSRTPTSSTNFKCNRSGRELKYAIKLAPSKLGQAQN